MFLRVCNLQFIFWPCTQRQVFLFLSWSSVDCKIKKKNSIGPNENELEKQFCFNFMFSASEIKTSQFKDLVSYNKNN